jgi:hypothetical protein
MKYLLLNIRGVHVRPIKVVIGDLGKLAEL